MVYVQSNRLRHLSLADYPISTCSCSHTLAVTTLLFSVYYPTIIIINALIRKELLSKFPFPSSYFCHTTALNPTHSIAISFIIRLTLQVKRSHPGSSAPHQLTSISYHSDLIIMSRSLLGTVKVKLCIPC